MEHGPAHTPAATEMGEGSAVWSPYLSQPYAVL